MFRHPAACLGLVLVTLPVAPVAGQTLRDTLKEHVAEGLDESKAKQRAEAEREKGDKEKAENEEAERKKKAAPASAPAEASRSEGAKPHNADKPRGETLFSFDSSQVEPPAVDDLAKKDEPDLPIRVIGEDLRIDVQLGAGYRGWIPQQYDAVDVEMGSYATWTIDVRAKLFKFLNLRRGYYESNGLSGPRTEQAAVAAQIGDYAPKAAWLLGAIGVPISKAWEPVIKYESRAFDTRATPREDVCVVPRDADPDSLDACPGMMGDLRIVSGFETLVAGVRYDHSKQGTNVVAKRRKSFPPVFFGVGLMQYRKPYQITIGDNTLGEYLFNGRFRGAGLALGTDLGGGIDQFFGEIDMQLGLGEVSLLESLQLNDLAPENWLIGYVQGTATIGYRWPIIRAAPTLVLAPALTGGGASFFFFETQPAEGEEGTSAPVNWDFLWAARISLLVPL